MDMIRWYKWWMSHVPIDKPHQYINCNDQIDFIDCY